MIERLNIYELELDPNSKFEVSSLEPTIKYVGLGGESWWSQTILLEGLTKMEIDTDEVITWLGKDKHTKFYKRGNLVEAEMVLEKKPRKGILGYKPNQIVCPTTLHNLVAHYQPPLTQAQIEQGEERPENVIGSHVFRHPTKGGIVTPAEVARGMTTGKLGNRYRPKVIDDQGNWVWAERRMIRGLTITTIPLDFFREARYPLRHAAGDNFGYTSLGGSLAGNTNRTHFALHTGAVGEGTSMTVGTELSSSSDFQLGLYKDSDLSFVKATSTGTSPSTKNWVTVNFAGGNPTLTAIDYLLHFFFPAANNKLAYDANATAAWYDLMTPFNWDDPCSKTALTTRDLSIYCTYTPAVVGGWAGGDVNGVAIGTIKNINGVALTAIKAVNGIT